MTYSKPTLGYAVGALTGAIRNHQKIVAELTARIKELEVLVENPSEITFEKVQKLHSFHDYDLSNVTKALLEEQNEQKLAERATFTLRRVPYHRWNNHCNKCEYKGHRLFTLVATDKRPSRYNTSDGNFCSEVCARKSRLIGAATGTIKIPSPYPDETKELEQLLKEETS